MDKMPENVDQLFLQLVLSMQASAMQQMGKIASPFTGKVERDLKAAQFSIDVVAMLNDKMKGNLSDEEAKIIEHVLYELRLNYVDESKKGDTPEPQVEEKEATEKTDAKTDEQSEKGESGAGE